MSDRLFKLILGVTFVVSLASFGAILLFLSPLSGGPAVYLLFSLTLLIVAGVTFGFLGIYLRKKFITQRNRKVIHGIALREGFMLSALGIFMLWLLHFDALNAWSAGAAVFVVLFAEYYFLSHRHAHS
jgi:hypothetical protein